MIKTPIKKNLLKQFLIAMLVVWLSLAMGNINLDEREINFFHNNRLARIFIVFVFAMLVLDIEKERILVRILMSIGIVVFYYFVAEY
jgi:hypothetical protein